MSVAVSTIPYNKIRKLRLLDVFFYKILCARYGTRGGDDY